MHFVTGGAFNGKRQWVKQYYPTGTTWFLASDYNSWPVPDKELDTIVVLEGLETWIKKEINVELATDIILEKNIKSLEKWLKWEKKKENRWLVLIGTDISKGIVPIEKENRLQRDITGWFYQRLVKQAERVDQVWYGISETLKSKED
ncbi:bifunctional adenosylcobinamide kinase/adenosylcobinamide-phosphate guanylyltransferase [Tetragenococcus halophilus]|uniref:bifunctional adenosylcobinamide kinase/adenosylcobinamide-phosphate guanylyltransferase n=1 Tax=Tetragenococcus halophilus TaxID=51669 RepID=UPI00077C7677|nr:bifunctional adenosylcobinamide kinase/adenosylcobinamide-phosphate guanylyltransferase [Tetragenococcus halophilus]MCF1601979.1 bifunctional adenosylcobinamide kinase/adenosylcobinamide-phosphate guanylyltransferase [Tetragenococcus halophilus]